MDLLKKNVYVYRIIIDSDRQPETKQGIEGKIVRFRSGRVRVRDKDCRSEPDRRSEAICFGTCLIQIADLNLTSCVFILLCCLIALYHFKHNSCI